MKNSTKIWLLIIFVVVVSARLLIAFQTTELNYEAYNEVRQVEHISSTGLPIFNDPLSYGGRTFIFSPVYHYFLALFDLVLPINIVLKLIPNILAGLTIFVVYHLSKFFTNNDKISLIPAAFSGFIPVFFSTTINNASIYTAVIPLFLLTTYYFLRTNKEPKFALKLIITMVIFTLVHPSSLILALSLLIYMGLIKLQNFRESSREPEVILFFLFFVIWLNMIIYQRGLSSHGTEAIWQNIPQALIDTSYGSITFLGSIYGIGFITLIFGLASIYISLFSSKKKTITLMSSVVLSTFILLFFRLIELSVGLIFLGISMAVLSAYSLKVLYDNSKTLKWKSAPTVLISCIILVFVLLFLPSINVALKVSSNTPSQEDIEAYKWLKNNTDEDSIIMTLPSEGSVMSYYADRKNVMDDNFLLVRNINRRYSDSTTVYTDAFITTALSKMNYYSVDYIVLSENNQEKNNITKAGFTPHECASQVYPKRDSNQTPKIYRINCVLKEN